MKNVQMIDGAENCVYDIFATTDDDFETIFPNGTDIAFIDEIYDRKLNNAEELDRIFQEMWSRPIEKRDVHGIHGIIFYELDHKKIYYPTRKDAEAINPGGTRLR